MLAAMNNDCGIYQGERLMRCRDGHLQRFRVHDHATHIGVHNAAGLIGRVMG